jgi:hypothetical protein
MENSPFVLQKEKGAYVQQDMARLYSAPVSHHGDSSHVIEPELTPSQVRLTSAEREAAHAAGVSEELYAKNKLKMEKMKKAKLIE